MHKISCNFMMCTVDIYTSMADHNLHRGTGHKAFQKGYRDGDVIVYVSEAGDRTRYCFSPRDLKGLLEAFLEVLRAPMPGKVVVKWRHGDGEMTYRLDSEYVSSIWEDFLLSIMRCDRQMSGARRARAIALRSQRVGPNGGR